jgi:hypothetical protein
LENIAGINYLAFDLKKAISEDELNIISRLSFVFALFELMGKDDKKTLLPVQKSNYEYLDPKIGSLLKYPGKTNELFTKMMINVALLLSDFDYSDKIKLLDPIAGKGTTLFEAAVYGYNSFGIEISDKSVHEASVFFKKYLEREKYKHQTEKLKFSIKKNSANQYKQVFDYAPSKEELKSDENRRMLTMVAGDARETSRYFKKNSFHLIVGDLPYGVAHGNISSNKQSSITRNPAELLLACLPEWFKVLKTGGALVLAWNKFVLPKHKIEELLKANSFEVFTESPYDAFEHRVDQSIKRDIVVARK